MSRPQRRRDQRDRCPRARRRRAASITPRSRSALPREQIVIGPHRDPAIECATPRGARPLAHRRASPADRRTARRWPRPARRVAGPATSAAPALARDRRRLAARIGRGDVRPARRENPVYLARHDVAFEPALRAIRRTRRRSRTTRAAAPWADTERTARCRAAAPRPSLRAPRRLRAVADDGDRQPRRSSAAGPPLRSGRSRFCDRPTLPECITTNRSSRPCARAKALSFGPGTIASQSAQLWITWTRPGPRPFPRRAAAACGRRAPRRRRRRAADSG